MRRLLKRLLSEFLDAEFKSRHSEAVRKQFVSLEHRLKLCHRGLATADKTIMVQEQKLDILTEALGVYITIDET